MAVPPESLLKSCTACDMDGLTPHKPINLNGLTTEPYGGNQHSSKSLSLGLKAAELIIHHLGEDPNREGLRETPKRFAKALNEICSGYDKSLSEVIGNGVFPSEGPGLIAVQSVEFFSMCEHHMLPFWGM